MKKGICLFLIIGLVLEMVFFVPMWAEQVQIPIQEQTFLVYRRYYFIARLHKTITLLAKMYQDVNAMQKLFDGRSIDMDALLPEGDTQQFRHIMIRRSIERMRNTRSLKPLFMVWDSFSTYKSLKDDLLVEDFSKEIFIITRNSIRSLRNKGISACLEAELCDEAPQVHVLELLDSIDVLSDHLDNVFGSQGADQAPAKRLAEVHDLKLGVHTDEVAFRFYCIQRLSRGADIINALPTNEIESLYQSVQMRFKSESTIGYADMLAFKKVWQDCVQYKYIEDTDFLRQCAFQLLVLLNEYVHTFVPQRASPYNDVIAIHQQIETIPVEHILTAIDTLVTQVTMLMDSYQKSDMTFMQWIKQHWWVPPLALSSIIWQCVKFYYKKMYGSGRPAYGATERPSYNATKPHFGRSRDLV